LKFLVDLGNLNILISRFSQIFCNTDGLLQKMIKPTNKALVILEEDAKCCVCFSMLQQGNTMKELPCQHIFHQERVVRWQGHCQKKRVRFAVHQLIQPGLENMPRCN
jgi:hypothetical protein